MVDGDKEQMEPATPKPGNSDSLPLIFLERAQHHFDFLSSEYSSSLSSGMYDHKKKKIVTPKFPLTSWFDFRVEYRTKLATFRISYGDRELIVEAKVIIADKEYGFWEILYAYGKDYKDAAGEQFVTTPERMDKVLLNVANSLRENMSLFENLGKKEFELIERRRENVREDWLNDIKKKELESKYGRARKLFGENRIVEAETILSPFEKIMTASQKKLLELIRKKKDF